MSNHQVAPITGVAITRVLHRSGHRIIIHYRDSRPEAMTLKQELCQRKPNSAALCYADLNNVDRIETLIAITYGLWSRLDIVINSSSVFTSQAAENVKLTEWETVLNTNLRVPFFLSQLSIKYLKQHQGCIINISDQSWDGH